MDEWERETLGCDFWQEALELQKIHREFRKELTAPEVTRDENGAFIISPGPTICECSGIIEDSNKRST